MLSRKFFQYLYEFRGCYYHFNRSLWRKAKALQIKPRPKKRQVAWCVRLPHIPKNFLNAGYQYVIGQIPVSEEINKLNKYFKKQRVYKDEILKYCCRENEQIRTNNNIEGWHTNKYTARKNPTLAHLLDVLKTESTCYDLGKVLDKKKKEYEEIDNEILSINDLKSGKICVEHCY